VGDSGGLPNNLDGMVSRRPCRHLPENALWFFVAGDCGWSLMKATWVRARRGTGTLRLKRGCLANGEVIVTAPALRVLAGTGAG